MLSANLSNSNKNETTYTSNPWGLVSYKWFHLAHPARFELTAYRLGGGRSILLSYGCIWHGFDYSIATGNWQAGNERNNGLSIVTVAGTGCRGPQIRCKERMEADEARHDVLHSG